MVGLTVKHVVEHNHEHGLHIVLRRPGSRRATLGQSFNTNGATRCDMTSIPNTSRADDPACIAEL